MLLSIVAKIYVPKWEFNRVLYEKVRSSCRLSILRVERHNHCKVLTIRHVGRIRQCPKAFRFSAIQSGKREMESFAVRSAARFFLREEGCHKLQALERGFAR